MEVIFVLMATLSGLESHAPCVQGRGMAFMSVITCHKLKLRDNLVRSRITVENRLSFSLPALLVMIERTRG